MAKSKKIAIVLAGCGVFDGAEIQEAVLSMYAIARQGSHYQVYAPDILQHHVINHITGQEMNEKRNVMVEAARIARGKIKPLSEFDASGVDGLLFPGGFGVAKNLCDWAFKGPDMNVIPEIQHCILDMLNAQKPIAALCIAPVLLAKIVRNVELTLGKDKNDADAIESMGATHHFTTHGEVIIDQKHKILTTPCYMLDATIDQIGTGAENIVKAMLELMD